MSSRVIGDSQGASFAASNNTNSCCTRHVHPKHVMRVGHIPDTDNIADMLTTALERTKFTEYAGIPTYTLSDASTYWKW